MSDLYQVIYTPQAAEDLKDIYSYIAFELRKARQGEEQTVFAMTAERVKWMDRVGIHQWNDTDYLSVYPQAYYRRNLDRLYVLAEAEAGRILCAAILFEKDERWDSGDRAFYIHNLVSVPDCPGAGTRFLQLVDGLAKERGMAYLRLDSADDNPKLAAYYEKLGFAPCGTCSDGAYHGILRQKAVQR